MDIWDNDPISDFSEGLLTGIGPGDDLPSTVNGLKISRDEAFNVVLAITSHASDTPKRKERPLGTVYFVDNNIEVRGRIGHGELRGVSLQNVTTKLASLNADTATTSTYSCNSLRFTVRDQSIAFAVDRVANMPGNYIWPDGFEEEESGSYSRTFFGEPPISVTKQTPMTSRVASTCLRLQFGGVTVIFGNSSSSGISKSKRPGYIFYSGNPDESVREKIRGSLSLAFGLPIIHFGTCFYSHDSNICQFESISPNTLGQKAWEIHSQPFAPITESSSNFLDREKIQRLAGSFFDNFESCDLRSFLYKFWYAETSPLHMRAAYYGAMVESIQKSKLQDSESGISHTIISKAEYRKAKLVISKFLKKQKIDAASAVLFQQKIDNANMAPQRVLAERFYALLGLKLGVLENSAWNKRNDAAHGNKLASGGEIEHFRSTKILRVILARIALKLVNGSDQYVDYYTLGHPVIALGDAIAESD